MPPENDQVAEPQIVETALPVEAPVVEQEPVAASEPAAPIQNAEANGEPAAPKTLLEAAMSALGKPDEAPAAAALPAEQPKGEEVSAPEAGEATADAPDGLPQIPADEFKALPKATRDAVKALRKEVKNLGVEAGRGVAVGRFLQTTGISPQEYAELLDVGALLKADPARAREALLKRLDVLDEHLGLKLPADIREDVDGGYMSEERAKELSQARARARHLESAAEQQTAASQQNAVLSDIAAWEAETSRTDTDFARKLPLLQEKTRLAVLERQAAGKPVTSSADAVEIVRKAYSAVNETMRSFAPAPAATRPTPKSAASAPAVAAAPKDIYEVAMRAAGLR